MTATRQLVVVIPARNEEQRLPRCLAALDTARRYLERQGDAPRVRIVVVLDRCTDQTATIAAGWDEVEVLVSDSGRVGAARALGVQHALRTTGAPPRAIWIACTDADSAVPHDWLHTQLRHARRGAHLVLGTVRPDPAEVAAPALHRWQARHDVADGHPHVYGANLGVRGDMYLRAGGFAPVAVHEDVLLVDGVRRRGGRVLSVGGSPVLTSARTSGRTPAGMAGYLRDLLTAQADPAEAAS